MRLLILIGLILAGCSSNPANYVPSKPVPQDRVYASYPKFFTGAYVTVRRDAAPSGIGLGCENEIYIDNIRAYTILPSEYATFFLTEGKHVIKVDTGRGSCQGRPGSEEITISNGISQEYKLISPPGDPLRLFRIM
ncbi:hypothetical protein LG201_03330 [Methylobacillus gramineus]|uniref:hypothetical protein n=1 Tax=Methylobacillus gramineus TaxID=755169 RepID=UPI001CFFE9F0|nr:hypothetical protein [Methylobacillus gramineus]MCB5184230.1 hypothetical protein [Methylobacillus gramineus]